MPKFSVVIPLYNKERDIEKTLKSVFTQTFQDFEVIIVNDGSTDKSGEIVQALQHPKVLFFDKKNEGVAPTRNFGVHKANAKYIAFLDADDYWHKDHLENLYQLINLYPNAEWYASAYEKQFSPSFISTMVSPILKKGTDWIGEVSDFFQNSLVDCLAWTSALCFKKKFFQKLGGFDTSITMGAGEDTDLWVRAALSSNLIFSNQVTSRHNLDGSNRISHSPTLKRVFFNPDKYQANAEKNKHLKKYLDLNRFSFSLKYKLAGDKETAKKYRSQISLDSLNLKQKILLKLPKSLLTTLWSLKYIFEKMGLRFSSFK